MEQYQPSFTDITEWNKKMYSSTGGTRAKNIYVNPSDDKEYFFKGSKKMPDGTIKYPTEFWSEIVASKIGQWLGFNVLDYNIGFDLHGDQKIGCLSKSMIDYSENKLSEGIEYLRGYDPKYNPDTDESRYTFEFIQQALDSFLLSDYEKEFVRMLIFDAIVGNSDRHQENWGFISKFKETITEIDKEIKLKKSFFGKIVPSLKKIATKSVLMQQSVENLNNNSKSSLLRSQHLVAQTVFSPIYDSGCCLGRELNDDKIDKMLEDPQMLEAFTLRGMSEVRWNYGKKKPRHFELLTELFLPYFDVFADVNKKIMNEFTEEKLEKLIYSIDSSLPKELEYLKLSEKRKRLMVKLISLRIKKSLTIGR